MGHMNIYSISEIKNFFEKGSLAPLRSLGQNFLINGSVSERITEASGTKGRNVLEVGPGLGSITEKLLPVSKQVVSVEIDRGMCSFLKSHFSETENFTLIEGDFLKTDIEVICQENFGGEKAVLVGNLPFYITSKCIIKACEAYSFLDSVTVMVQKEVGERLVAGAGEGEYGAISAFLSYFSGTEYLFDVSRENFYPVPEVDSCIIRIDLRPRFDIDLKDYADAVRGLFLMRRKTVKNNLKNYYRLSASDTDAVLEKAGIDGKRRAETMTAEEFVRVAEAVSKTRDGN